MVYVGATERKRIEILHLCDTMQALYAFNYQLGDKLKAELTTRREVAKTATVRELRELRAALDFDIQRAVDAFGCIERPAKFAAAFKSESRSETGIMHMPKWYIDKFLFTNFCGDRRLWQSFPPHTYVALDYLGEYKQGEIEYHLPEAVLYEDMCLAYNAAWELRDVSKERPISRIKSKTLNFNLRTAVLTAFYFVEAFLNGVAFDYDYRNQAKLTPEQRELLLEWNFKDKRERWVNFRQKLLQYPKLILGLTAPPFTETNCPEMQTLLTQAKDTRDSIVHQSPKLNPLTDEADKIKWMLHLRLKEATEVVDAAVSLVRKLNTALKADGIRLDWLYQRDSQTEMFPPESFK